MPCVICHTNRTIVSSCRDDRPRMTGRSSQAAETIASAMATAVIATAALAAAALIASSPPPSPPLGTRLKQGRQWCERVQSSCTTYSFLMI